MEYFAIDRAEKDSGKDEIEIDESPTRSSMEEEPWPTTNGLDDFVETFEENGQYEKSQSAFQSNCPPTGNSLTEEILHPTFATGWATSQETKPLNQVASGPVDDRNDQSYLSAFWPVGDLGLKNLQVSNDGDLGMIIMIHVIDDDSGCDNSAYDDYLGMAFIIKVINDHDYG